MKDLTYLDSCRVDMRRYYGSMGDAKNGVFKVFVGGRSFFVIASSGDGWELDKQAGSGSGVSTGTIHKLRKIVVKEGFLEG